MEDPFNRNLVAAAAISSSQEEILRRSLFVRSGNSHSSSSSSSSAGSGPGGAPYWISHRAVTMRSASDSHHSSSSSSSSDARSCGGRGGSEVAQSLGAEENLDGGDGGEGSGLPGNRGDRIVGRVKRKKNCVLKRKGSPVGRIEKRSRHFSEESNQEPNESPVVSPRGRVVGKRLGSSRSGKEAVETERGDGDSRTEPRGVENEGGDRSANDELARFRYVRTGVPPLRHSPPELLKDALGSPKLARGGARRPPQQSSPVAREPADGEVIKDVAVRSPQGTGKGLMRLNSPSPSTPDEPDGERGHGSGATARSHCSTPLGAGPSTSVQLQNSVEPEEEGPPPPAMGLGTSSPVAREPADGKVIKDIAVRSPQGTGKGLMGLNSPSPSTPDEPDGERGHGSGATARSHGSTPLGASPSISVQLQNSVEPEEEGPPAPAMGSGASSPVEVPQQPEGLRAVEKSPSGDARSLASPTETATGGEDIGIRCSSDLVDLLIKFSKKFDRRLENVDFVDVLEMKGNHVPPPRWWRPRGYPKEK